jgi:hypothetical protein
MKEARQTFDGQVRIVLGDESFGARGLFTGYIEHEDIPTFVPIPFDGLQSWSGYLVDVDPAAMRRIAIQKFQIVFIDGRVAEAILQDGMVVGIGLTPF